MKSKQCLENSDSKQNGLVSFLRTRRITFHRHREKPSYCHHSSLGPAFCPDWPPRGYLALPPWGRAAGRCPHTPTASPLIYRHDREVLHPEHSFLAARAPCSLSHHHLWAVLFPTSFPASALTPHLTSHCFSLCFVPHVPHYWCFLFCIIPGWGCAEPSISWPTVSHVSFCRGVSAGFQLSVGVFATRPVPSWEGTNLKL